MPAYDLLLRGGTLIDGSGAPRREADVAIAGERVVDLGRLEESRAKQVIDVRGLVVAPGFIDVHNHSDGWLLKIPHQTAKTSQGITSEVLMSDGISYAPLTPETAAQWLYYLRSLNGLHLSDYSGWQSIADYLALLDRRNVQNVIAQVPYANVRTMAMGWGRGIPDDSQIRQMQFEIRRGMEAGAVGLSTGLDYVAQCFAVTDELVEVCRAMAPDKGLYVTHVRYKKGVLAGVQEAVEIGRRAGVAVHISHLKGDTPRQVEELLDYIDRVAVHEVDFSFDVYPYLPGSTMLNSLLPYEVWEDGPLAVLGKLTLPAIRRRFAAQLADYRTPLEEIRIAWISSKAHGECQGMRLSEYVAQTGRAAADALADLLIETNLAVLCVFHRGDDRLVEPFLKHPKFMLGSDGIYFANGIIHPRHYGSATRILGPLVRDRRLFSLEEAVRKLSGLPAERFGLKDRGLLRPGSFADVVVFDPHSVTDQATFDQPHRPSTGIQHVLVNGVLVVRDSRPVEFAPASPLPGRALRFHA